jgi:Polyketide cyclase / dehydrase and lipid transport
MMLTVGRTIAASAQSGWDVLVDLDAWPRWGPTVRRAELDHPSALALGSTGRVWTPIGIALPFVITEFDQGRSWAWAVAGVPATGHRVEPRGEGCRITFQAPLWAPGYLPVLAVALRRIDGLLRR